ncbi:unnamed protein product [Calicophoron daubneyi]|uniref:Leucine-rich repeat-containing protein 51 n=1 Tax=Calicophoron daubneyi TaxID=300641 RepID=A0AAV2TPC8_CALDB
MTDASAPITQSDKLAKIYQPLDYSFYDIKEVADIHNNEPRFLPGLKLNCPKSSSGKWLTKTLKLNNNLLEGLQDVPTIVTELFGCPEWITWLDVSCNKIHAISPAIKQLCSLKILYLHGNQIKAMQEVQRLTNLPDLVKLTLHGNPVEREKGYFHLVLGILPNLLSLDFTGVSAADHQTADAYRRQKNRPKKTKD